MPPQIVNKSVALKCIQSVNSALKDVEKEGDTDSIFEQLAAQKYHKTNTEVKFRESNYPDDVNRDLNEPFQPNTALPPKL